MNDMDSYYHGPVWVQRPTTTSNRLLSTVQTRGDAVAFDWAAVHRGAPRCKTTIYDS